MREALLGILLLGSVPLALADTVRCKDTLITEGDSTALLLIKCGEPLLKEELTRFEENGFGARITVKYGERWTYNFGKQRFMQMVTVVNGTVTEIENGPPGE
ncbi:DUF2845 domain-containing protein [Aeromonas diversa]|uniref:DUF2845 domain-containing protein n=1 Tax=Aeromonas diversa CDC 2478-85 TaxID=1268237 RepID=N9VPS4_9GAMM|nr:DUF2845 domain-containing protein [Aeromonas diversa]ENY73558.1 hypothetical protein G114_02304 [Aeromonas diversa CDC 2478-85]